MMPKLYVKTLSWEWSGPYWGAPMQHAGTYMCL